MSVFDHFGEVDGSPPLPTRQPEAEIRLAVCGGELVIAGSVATLEALARELNPGGGGYVAFYSMAPAVVTIQKKSAPSSAPERT